jgi:predicted nucleic acid-binding protein
MPDRVVDASAVAALIFAEEAGAAVREVLRGHAMHAPALIEFELANTAWKRTRRFPHRAAEFELALEGLSKLPVQYRRIDRQAVLRLAVEMNLSAYDASYLWLARSLGVPLITLDKKLAAAAEKL